MNPVRVRVLECWHGDSRGATELRRRGATTSDPDPDAGNCASRPKTGVDHLSVTITCLECDNL